MTAAFNVDGYGMLQPGSNCWRIERATRASVIVDADDYFRFARSAMRQARYRIMLIGWDFDARIKLVRSADADDGPEQVGDFIYWLVEQNLELEVYLLRWDMGALQTVFRGSTILTVLKWMRHPRIHTKLDSVHPPAASHHQKIVVIDDCFAFCGGIDMTSDRWDTREHLDHDPGRRRPNGKPYEPWHDATTALEGPVAAALGDLCRERWQRASGVALSAISGRTNCWPDALPVDFQNTQVAIARSAPEVDGRPPLLEIERLYLDQIARAERFIYVENQYFTSRRIAIALAGRLDEQNGPEIIIINPLAAQGLLEPLVMDTARARLYEALRRRDKYRRLRIYHPLTAGGEPIYVHAKILIIDDRALRVGSSNMNNRSLRLDTECDVTVDTALAANTGCGSAIEAVRDSLMAEHLGVAVETVVEKIEQTGSLIATIESLRGRGKTLYAYKTPNLSAVEEWLANNDVLDPAAPDETFEALSKRGLFRRHRQARPVL